MPRIDDGSNERVWMRTVKRYGNGAMIPFLKRYVGREVEVRLNDDDLGDLPYVHWDEKKVKKEGVWCYRAEVTNAGGTHTVYIPAIGIAHKKVRNPRHQ